MFDGYRSKQTLACNVFSIIMYSNLDLRPCTLKGNPKLNLCKIQMYIKFDQNIVILTKAI